MVRVDRLTLFLPYNKQKKFLIIQERYFHRPMPRFVSYGFLKGTTGITIKSTSGSSTPLRIRFVIMTPGIGHYCWSIWSCLRVGLLIQSRPLLNYGNVDFKFFLRCVFFLSHFDSLFLFLRIN